MSARVLLNLLNKFRKSDKLRGLRSIFFRNNFNKFNIIKSMNVRFYLSHGMRFPTMWYVRPAKAQTSLGIRAN